MTCIKFDPNTKNLINRHLGLLKFLKPKKLVFFRSHFSVGPGWTAHFHVAAAATDVLYHPLTGCWVAIKPTADDDAPSTPLSTPYAFLCFYCRVFFTFLVYIVCSLSVSLPGLANKDVRVHKHLDYLDYSNSLGFQTKPVSNVKKCRISVSRNL